MIAQYRVVLADPPWPYHNGGNGRARAHYPLMSAADILALPVAGLAAADCVLILWATWPMLDLALDCIRAWGFRHRTGFPWVKVKRHSDPDDPEPAMATGYWARGCSEPVLVATCGQPRPPTAHGRHWLGLLGPRLEHSRKPPEIHAYAETWPAPRIELFARQARAGWDVWGNQAPGSIDWWPGCPITSRQAGQK